MQQSQVTPVRAWATVAILSALYVVSFVDRLVLALLVEPIKAELGVSDVQIGLLIGTSFAIFYSLAGLPIARIADTGNRVLLITAGALLWGLTTAGAAFADSFAVLLILRIGVAFGEAALTPAAMSLMGDMFTHEKRALPYSVYVMIGVCGGSAAMLIGAFVLEQVSGTQFILPFLNGLSPWRLTLFFVGLPAVLLAIAIPLIVREPRRILAAGTSEPLTREVIAHLRDNRTTYLGFFGVTAMVSIVNFSVLAWFPSHLIRSYGLPPATAGYLFGIFGVVASIIGGLLLPFCSRRMVAGGRPDGHIRVAIVALMISTPLLIAALLAPSARWSIALVAVPLVCQLGLGILLAAVAPLLAPGRVRAQMVALYYLVISLIGLGVGPLLVAALSEALFPPAQGIGRSLASVVLLFGPVQLGLLFWSRGAFGRSYRTAAETERSAALA